jgi:two-component system, chemotaxis family, protein-glutamate methylesterase/glutaminase
MIKVLVVEDSSVARELLVGVLAADPEIEVIGTAHDGKEAIEFVNRNKPDVITMDIYMPIVSGIEATRKIMETNPVPIIVVSGSWSPEEAETTFRVMEAGAIAIVQRPTGPGHPDHTRMVVELLQTVKAMSEVKVVRRWPRSRKGSPVPPARTDNMQTAALPLQCHGINAIAIGASIGGPIVLQTILSNLPSDLPAPLLIVQHMASGFIEGMLAWLQETSRIQLHIAKDAEQPIPGQAYFAPDGRHMGVDRSGRICLVDSNNENGAKPSVSYLFRSVANAFGKNGVGLLLTGMGRDGAQELKLMKDKGALTIAQDKESSVVYGMPGVATEIGAATYTLSPDRIIEVLKRMTGTKR